MTQTVPASVQQRSARTRSDAGIWAVGKIEWRFRFAGEEFAAQQSWPSKCPDTSGVRARAKPGEKRRKGAICLLGDHEQNLHQPNIKIVGSNDGVVACLCGRIDIDFAPALRRQLLSLIEAPNLRKISIDLSQITHIDSSGIATLIEALKIARASDTALKLQGMHARLLRLLEVTGILPLFNGHDDEMSHPGYKAV